MKFAVNYSEPLADLWQNGRVTLDRFKCPAWPDVVAKAQTLHACYVHLPLKVGQGVGYAIDTEKKQAADWHRLEKLVTQTDTPFINLHLVAETAVYPDLPPDTTHPTHLARVIENMVRDVTAVVKRFGADRVIVENINDHTPAHLHATFLPEVITAVVEATGCGLLLDLSHARLAAHYLGLDARDYIAALPVTAVREIHVTGIQPLDAYWLDRLQAAGASLDKWGVSPEQLVDHLPMVDADWEFLGWVMAEIEAGRWQRPFIIAFEYGGVGPIWSDLTDSDSLAEQLPRMYDLIKGARKTAVSGKT